MKRILLISIISAAMLLGACSTAPTPPAYVPKYTADQVIKIAQAQYPVCTKRENLGEDASGMFRYTTVNTPSLVSVLYVGGSRAAWKVEVKCPTGYRHQDNSWDTTKTLYFYETNGSLSSTYYP